MKKFKIAPSSLFNNYDLCINRQEHQTDVKLHTHSFKELVIIMAGQAVHFSGNDSYPIMAGDCFVVDEAHGYRESVGFELVNVLFIPDKLNLPWNEARKLPGYNAFFALEPRYRKEHNFRSILRLSPDKLATCSSIIDNIEVEISQKRSGFEFVSTSLFMQLIAIISRAYASSAKPQHITLMGISNVISHIENRFSEEIRLTDLMTISKLSEGQLLREFRKATGHTPVDYLLRLRLRNAAHILRHEKCSITDIAFRCGFNDSNYFTRQFTRVLGMSPREYRNLRTN